MSAPTKWVLAGLGALSALASALGTIWIFAIMILIGCDVIGRQFFDAPIVGVTEIVSQSIVGIVFLQLADAQRRGRMIRSDVFLARILKSKPAFGYALLSFHNLAGAVLMATLCWFSWPRLVDAWANDEYVGSLGNFTMAIWPFVAIVVVASGMSALYYLAFALSPRYAAEVEMREAVVG